VSGATGDALALTGAALAALLASVVLVRSLERLAGRLRLTEALLGVVVALAADTPEITSAITAFARGQSTVGNGVVLGSNVFNLAALLGLSGIVAARIALHRRVVLLEGVPACWIAAVAVAVVVGGLPPGIGLIAVALVVVPYLAVAASTSVRASLPAPAAGWVREAVREEEAELALAIHPRRGQRADAAVAAASLLVVVAASVVMEHAAVGLGTRAGLSELVVGGVVLAALTSLPNAVGAVYLATRARGPAVLSEAMNSNMLNVVVGLLIPGVVLGVARATSADALVAWWYVGLTALCVAVSYAGRGIRRATGAVIVACYAAFVVAAVRW